MNIAVVGGGKRCKDLMDVIQRHTFQEIHPKIVAVADIRPDAPALVAAMGKGLFITNSYDDFFDRDDIDLIVELTGSMDIYNDILAKKKKDVQAISTRTAQLFWEVARASTMQQEKLASVGLLSAGVAHEINNPLTTILTTAILVQEDLGPDDPINEELSTIVNEVLRCRKIVANLMDFARQSKPDKRNHTINDIIAACISLTQKQAAFKDVSVAHDLSDNLPRTLVDKGQIEQAMINLIINAVEATSAGGSIHVSTRASDRKGFIDIVVSDTGEGIPKDRIGQIFDPFFTTKENGTGLGLSITHGIIEQHGGNVSANSNVGEGTTFTITIPGEEVVNHAP